MIGQAGATGEAFCQQQVPAATLAPQFVSGLGLEMVKSVLVQPIRCEMQMLCLYMYNITTVADSLRHRDTPVSSSSDVALQRGSQIAGAWLAGMACYDMRVSALDACWYATHNAWQACHIWTVKQLLSLREGLVRAFDLFCLRCSQCNWGPVLHRVRAVLSAV